MWGSHGHTGWADMDIVAFLGFKRHDFVSGDIDLQLPETLNLSMNLFYENKTKNCSEMYVYL